MPALTLTALVPWIIANGYFIFFLAAVIEGTLVTIAAGVAAGLGYYSIVIIILISIAGDLIADVLWYFLGYYGRHTVIEHYGHYIGVTKERMDKFEKMVHTHFRKTMLVVKISPFIPVPGLVAIGAAKAPLRKFIEMSLLVTVPKSICFALLGFYSGRAYTYLDSIVNNGSYIWGGLILIILIIYFTYQKITANISKKTEIE